MSTVNAKDLDNKTYPEIVQIAKELGCFMPKKNAKKTRDAVINRIKNHLSKGGSATAASKTAAKAKPVTTNKKAAAGAKNSAAAKKSAAKDDAEKDDAASDSKEE
ncbi:expressed protein [Dictyostelium purpureum]|uniref:Expressed protein n=1 Tax=Dictyostelium purpureum TaxID=5786 RepID=F0ZEC1_DICPU|nr:uncharacterized protein DICPUDRAFT_94018 [Dictyostelium purpureum]EGC37744.1 expressed protein [Dictyostelium purpureum]|eukprot:XP_003285765.1 expressed protein [Dictyostelium purpureum]